MKRFASASAIALATAVACDALASPSSGGSAALPSPAARYEVRVVRPLGGTVASVDANGKPDGKIRCGSRPADSACGPATFKANEAVVLTVTADDGFVFEEWAADCSGSGLCALDARGRAAEKRVVAVFAPAEPEASKANRRADRTTR
jgi:hypothetical protein